MKYILLSLLLACGTQEQIDTDGDGLYDEDEILFNTDPNNPDTDGDYLSDGEEIGLGTDPTNSDTDGDTYLDGDETVEGKDPLRKSSRIYKGYWPYWRDKDSLGDGQQKISRLIGEDQFGDRVDLYDFAGPDQTWKFMIIDVSAEWCGPCKNVASWLSGGSDPYGLESQYGPIREAVNDGRIVWVTVISQDSFGNPATGETSESWDVQYHNKNVPVLADDNFLIETQIVSVTGTFPSGALVKTGKMNIENVGSVYDILDLALTKI